MIIYIVDKKTNFQDVKVGTDMKRIDFGLYEVTPKQFKSNADFYEWKGKCAETFIRDCVFIDITSAFKEMVNKNWILSLRLKHLLAGTPSEKEIYYE